MSTYSLGPLEQEVMSCLWDTEGKKVGEVHKSLEGKRVIAYTTVMTIMTRLAEKGFLTRKRSGKAYVYTPRATKQQTARKMVGGIFTSLVNQFGEDAVVALSDELEHKKRRK